MKFIYSIVVLLTFTFVGFAQEGIYVKYETAVDPKSEDAGMMAMMMNGSTMEVAYSNNKSWIETKMGTMMTMTLQMDTKKKEMTMLMSGLMGNMAFQGDPDELAEDNEKKDNEMDMKLINETKKILGYKCKKAMITDEKGNQATYWYNEKFKRPEGMTSMPNQVPGLCLEFETTMQGGMKVTYTAIEVEEEIDIKEYKITIPEGTNIMSLSDIKNMGLQGK